MNLAAKASIGGSRGYAMAALLVAIAVMAVMLSVAMPTWSHMIRREKEEELIFRGNQYARAISLYQRKYANASPANLDVLIKERMLRKKFKDPLSPNKDGEFQLLHFQGTVASRGAGAGGAGSGPGGRGIGISGSIGPSPTGTGPIVGVVSKNPSESIKVYKDKTHYNEWQFMGIEFSSQPGGAGAVGPGGRVGRGGRDGRGGPPSREGFGGRFGGGRGQEGQRGFGPGRSFTTPEGGTTFTPRGGPP